MTRSLSSGCSPTACGGTALPVTRAPAREDRPGCPMQDRPTGRKSCDLGHSANRTRHYGCVTGYIRGVTRIRTPGTLGQIVTRRATRTMIKLLLGGGRLRVRNICRQQPPAAPVRNAESCPPGRALYPRKSRTAGRSGGPSGGVAPRRLGVKPETAGQPSRSNPTANLTGVPKGCLCTSNSRTVGRAQFVSA
jgi:hypothetical protein